MQEGVNDFSKFLPIVLRCENSTVSLRARSRCDGDGHIKGEADGLAYSTQRRNEKYSQNLFENKKGRRHLKDLGGNGRKCDGGYYIRIVAGFRVD